MYLSKPSDALGELNISQHWKVFFFLEVGLQVDHPGVINLQEDAHGHQQKDAPIRLHVDIPDPLWEGVLALLHGDVPDHQQGDIQGLQWDEDLDHQQDVVLALLQECTHDPQHPGGIAIIIDPLLEGDHHQDAALLIGVLAGHLLGGKL